MRPLRPGSDRRTVRGNEGSQQPHARWVKFIDRRKRHTLPKKAIARELAISYWALAVLEE